MGRIVRNKNKIDTLTRSFQVPAGLRAGYPPTKSTLCMGLVEAKDLTDWPKALFKSTKIKFVQDEENDQ